MTQTLFEVPNLDYLSTDPDDYKRVAHVLRILTRYCEAKRSAMRERLAGRIGTARGYEKDMEFLYLELPPEYRW